MIAALLFLILLFLVGKWILGTLAGVAGAAVALVLILIVFLVKRRRK